MRVTEISATIYVLNAAMGWAFFFLMTNLVLAKDSNRIQEYIVILLTDFETVSLAMCLVFQK
jgi:hypothetical protein